MGCTPERMQKLEPYSGLSIFRGTCTQIHSIPRNQLNPPSKLHPICSFLLLLQFPVSASIANQAPFLIAKALSPPSPSSSESIEAAIPILLLRRHSSAPPHSLCHHRLPLLLTSTISVLLLFTIGTPFSIHICDASLWFISGLLQNHSRSSASHHRLHLESHFSVSNCASVFSSVVLQLCPEASLHLRSTQASPGTCNHRRNRVRERDNCQTRLQSKTRPVTRMTGSAC